MVALGAAMALNGCQDSPTEEQTAVSTERSGRVSLRVEVGAIGVLARSSTMTPSRLVLRFTSPGVPDVVDTVSMATTSPGSRDYSLAGGRTWTLAATDYDGQDSVLHLGAESFRVGFDSTTNVRMSLEAKYSSFTLRLPRTDRTSRFFLGVDGATWCDTAPASVAGQKDTVKIQRDYLTASRAGVPHAFSLKVSGNRGDKDTVLYALDTTLPVISGESRSHRLALRWVGPLVPKNGQARMEVTLGAVGQVDFEITYLDPGLACGEWKDVSGFAWNPAISYGTLCDTRDGKVYRTVVIGSQRWMAENLNYAGIHQTRLGYCEDGLDCEVYGRHYGWSESMAGEAGSLSSPSGVRGICPAGWHIPSHEEWQKLSTSIDGANATASTKLRALASWNRNAGTDQYGFRVLGGGFQLSNMPIILGKGDISRFWSASPADPSTVWTMEFSASTPEIAALGLDPWRGHHLRCLQD